MLRQQTEGKRNALGWNLSDEIVTFVFFGNLLKNAVREPPGFAQDDLFFVVLIVVSAVRENIEGMAHAVGVGDIFVEPLSIQQIILHLLIVGENVDIRQLQTVEEPGKFRGGLACLFRLGPDNAAIDTA